jgi:hypothetical protein
MITTAGRTNWPSDITIADLRTAGLPRPCVVRFKLFTLPNAIIVRLAGTLGQSDRDKVFTGARAIFL